MQFAIIDFEATCGDTVQQHSREIIEFACIIVDDTWHPIKEFDMFVQPVLAPQLTPFCTDLTSITQADVDTAEQFPRVLAAFRLAVGFIEDTIFCSWGNYDKNQLLQDCNLHGTQYPFVTPHLNLKNITSQKLKVKPMGVERALAHLKLEFQGRHHRGIDDVRNIIQICKRAEVDLIEVLRTRFPKGTWRNVII